MSGPGKGYGDNLTYEIFDMTHSIILVCCSVLQSVAMCCNVSSVRCGDNEDHFALKCSKKTLRIVYINIHICTCVHLNMYFCANIGPGKDDDAWPCSRNLTSAVCATRLIHTCDMTHLYIRPFYYVQACT